MIKEIEISSNQRNELIDITSRINDVVKESGIKEGFCIIYCPHTTAAITINEGADPDVKDDLLMQLEKISPLNKEYKHAEGNSDAHVKSSLIGVSKTILIENSSLMLGTWQKIYFAEFDGARDRKVIIKVIEG